MDQITVCKLVSLEPNSQNRAKKEWANRFTLVAPKRNYDSLTRLSKQTRQVSEMAKRCTPSQTDVLFVAMDALVRTFEDDLIATRIVTAIPQPYALGLSCIHAKTL